MTHIPCLSPRHDPPPIPIPLLLSRHHSLLPQVLVWGDKDEVVAVWGSLDTSRWLFIIAVSGGGSGCLGDCLIRWLAIGKKNERTAWRACDLLRVGSDDLRKKNSQVIPAYPQQITWSYGWFCNSSRYSFFPLYHQLLAHSSKPANNHNVCNDNDNDNDHNKWG